MLSESKHKEYIKELSLTDFWAFCCFYDFDFFINKPFFLLPVAEAFQTVIDEYRKGNAITVSVSMPPRAGKSYITSLFAAYWLAQFPELSVMRNSCTSTLYQKFSYDTRAIIRSDKFRAVFPEIELSSDKQKFLTGANPKTSKQVGYFGSGVGGTIIGFGANLAITDDLYKSMQDALSSNTNAFVKTWKESAHDSRKEKNCPEIYIGTRWTLDDVIGEVAAKCNAVITIPALIEEQSFCEDVKSTAEYLEIRENISKSVWMAEYMQNPLSVDGLLLPFDVLQFADFDTVPVFSFAIGDPADTGGDKYSMPFVDVYQVGAKVVFYVRDVIHSTYGIEANTNRINDKAKANRTEQIFIESNGVGLAAVLLLKKIINDTVKITPFPSTINKEVRILSHYEFIQANFIFSKQQYEAIRNTKLLFQT